MPNPKELSKISERIARLVVSAIEDEHHLLRSMLNDLLAVIADTVIGTAPDFQRLSRRNLFTPLPGAGHHPMRQFWQWQLLLYVVATSDELPRLTEVLDEPQKVNERFKNLVITCGLPVGRTKQGLTLHALRRFFKTYTLDAGVPEPMVDHWMADWSSMDSFYYDPQKSKEWMERVPFGEPSENDLRRLKGGDQ